MTGETNDNPAAEGPSLEQIVTFQLGEEEYAFDILTVREVNRMMEITRVPRAPDFIEGVVNLRGNVIPVIDLRKRFGLPERTPDNATRIVVCDVDSRVVGFIVDTVREVLWIQRDKVEPPGDIAGIDAEYIRGVGKIEERLLILLDVARVLTPKEKEILEEGS
ncbi:MAG: chemotaxis protein CheW [Planctomycetota bacterium]|jgi:purine-binding chemotaxis protein CheW